MPTLAIYLDQDGVLADFDAGVRRILGWPETARNPFNVATARLSPELRAAKDVLYQRIAADPTFNATLPRLPGVPALLAVAAPFGPVVLTAAPSTFLPGSVELARVDANKWTWCQQELGFTDRADFLCTTSAAKPAHVGYVVADVQLLIDDRAENCEAWCAAGGEAIHHRDVATTVETLTTMITARALVPPDRVRRVVARRQAIPA